ncbi:MAG: hypothetical protein RLZZ242_399 [Bacteroidota bacterium]
MQNKVLKRTILLLNSLIMDLLLIILGSFLLIVGIIGCFVPVIPGPIIAYFALLVLKLSATYSIGTTWLWVFGILAVSVSIIDNVIPVYTTKRFGGSRAGTIGSLVGLVVGLLFFPPVGFLFGPLLGAFAGELYVHQSDMKAAARAALGALLGVLAGSLLKLALVLWMAWVFYTAL